MGQPEASCTDPLFQSDDLVDDDNALSVQARLVTLGSTKVSKRTVETKSVSWTGVCAFRGSRQIHLTGG